MFWFAIGLQVREPGLMRAICTSIVASIDSLGPQNAGLLSCTACRGQVSNAVWAWAALRHRDLQAMEAMAARAMQSGAL